MPAIFLMSEKIWKGTKGEKSNYVGFDRYIEPVRKMLRDRGGLLFDGIPVWENLRLSNDDTHLINHPENWHYISNMLDACFIILRFSQHGNCFR